MECINGLEEGHTCWRCGGRCLIPIYDNDNVDSMVIIHNHTDSGEFEEGESELTHAMMHRVAWPRIVQFFNMSSI
jgi:hypothetical protein